MKRLKLRWIIGLMGLSMIGLIAFQLYWINGLVKANEERFRKDVLEALNNVANKLEKQEAIATYKRLHQLSIQEERAQSERAFREQFARRADQPQVPPQPKFEVVKQGNQEVFMFFDTVVIGEDFQIAINFSSGGSQYFYSDMPSNNSLDPVLDRDREIMELENQLDKVSRQYEMTWDVVRDLMGPQRSLTSRLNPRQLDSLLEVELNSKGIDIDYDYGVIAPSLNRFVVLTNDQKKDQLLSTELKASLFPNDVFDNNNLLVIDFPKKRNFLISKVWSSLLTSGFLVAVILFCFGYSIKTIVHQKKLSEMKNDFINNMTHELKTPISTVSLAAEALSDRDIEQSSLRDKYLRVINEENKRLGDQVEKVLQMAAIDKQDYNLKEEMLAMNDLVRDAAANISMQVEQRGGRINLIDNASDDRVKGDKTHLTNIVLNLLDNANKYSSESPNITLRTESHEDEYNLTVQDHGIGMTKEQQKHIFQKFYRVPTGDLHDVKGFGLGLAYVHSMIEAHGGSIHVSSEPGKGSKFSISLPLSHEA